MANQYPGTPIGPGSTRRDAVRAIQTRLFDLNIPQSSGGRPLQIDGDFGPATEAAVRLFQTSHSDPNGASLLMDGVVGPMTWATLFDLTVKIVASASPLLRAVLSKAQSQVGIREQPPGSNRGPEVDAYLRAAGINPASGSYAWCVAFLYWCFEQGAAGAGVANPMPRTAGVHDLWNRCLSNGLYRLSPTVAQQRPELVKPGMIFFLDAGQGMGHAGIVKSVEGVSLRTIEGNTTDIAGSREGVGVFERTARTIGKINLGFADVSRSS